MMELPLWSLCVLGLVIGYSLGSIPVGLLLCQWKGKGDIRKTGSGNIGATNVLRAGGKKLAAMTLLLDIGKAFLAVYILLLLGGDRDFSYVTEYCDGNVCQSGSMIVFPWPMAMVALGVLLGHVYPVWLRFKGGKGVAVFIGMALALHPLIGGIVIAVWLGMAFGFRISSLAALVAIGISPILAYFLSVPVSDFGGGSSLFAWFYTLLYFICASLIWFKHKDNIQRLLKGAEPKIGAK